MRNIELWEAIEGLSIGPEDARLSFSQRLARENGWTPVFTDEVIREYRKFIYLVALGNGELTPSDQVDQAWHLHLTYTHSYWIGLCGTVLGRNLHHLPTKGGDAEQGRFRTQYEKTLAVYERELGYPPPAAIWPPVDERFRNTEHFVRSNRATHWMVKKPSSRLRRGAVLLSIPLLLVACSESAGDYDIWFWLKLAFGLFVLYKLFDWLDSGGRAVAVEEAGAAVGARAAAEVVAAVTEVRTRLLPFGVSCHAMESTPY